MSSQPSLKNTLCTSPGVNITSSQADIPSDILDFAIGEARNLLESLGLDESNDEKKALTSQANFSDLRAKVEHLVDSRLQELTPEMVKNIIQKMIRHHLGWLVVWGGVFGGLIGLIASVVEKL